MMQDAWQKMAASPVSDDPLNFIDGQSYSIGDRDPVAMGELVRHCRENLDRDAICVLPGFVREDALAQMVREAEALIGVGYYYDRLRPAYVYDDQATFPAGHARALLHQNRYRQVLNHQIPNNSIIRRLFLCSALTEFVRQILGCDRLYTSACPHLALTLQIAHEGDCNGWHYNPNDGVVTLLLQAPDSGGVFEYAPYIRGEPSPKERDDEKVENYEAIGRLFADPAQMGRRVPIRAGDFTLFNGSRSMHRVSKVGSTDRPRIVAIFSYDRRPDMVFSQGYVDLVRSFPQDCGIDR
ncbi:MAG: hypothetical protein AAF530_12120 [Pseudomonadota bacterium]